MKLLNGKIYITFRQAVDGGLWADKYLRKAKSTGSKSIVFLDDPADNRKVLIEWDCLNEEKKRQFELRFGNPADYLAKEPIRKMVIRDLAAHKFYSEYRYDNCKMLPIDKVEEYTTAASWLNMLLKADENKREIKQQLSLTVTQFFVKVLEVIASDRIALPESYVRLRDKINQYKEQGYKLLIHKQYGNQNARKMSEVGEALLLELLSKPYHDDVIICRLFNEWAAANNHEQIAPATVGIYRRQNEAKLLAEKEGNAAWYNKYGRQIIRRRPSAPLLLVGSDDNDLDLYFQADKVNKKGHTVIDFFNRVKLIVVMDAFNDYILGYAWAKEVTADVVREAYLNAVHHVRQLTGGWYLPHQLQTDRWGKGTLTSFYESIAIYTPATAKAPRGKYIERAFGTQWHQRLAFYPNYAGHNITAKSKLNTDAIERAKREFPALSQAPVQIEQFINIMRSMKDEATGLTKQEQWLQAFQASEKAQERRIDDMQMLILFGRHHDYKNTITNRGLTPAINCIERTYQIPDELYLQVVGCKAQVIYDPLDYSRILVQAGSTRFIAPVLTEEAKMPSAIADYQPGDRARLNAALNHKKEHVLEISRAKEERQQLLNDAGIDAEGLLRIGHILPKEISQQAALNYQNKKHSSGTYDPLDQM